MPVYANEQTSERVNIRAFVLLLLVFFSFRVFCSVAYIHISLE